jgi:hypothetical protein
MRKGEIARLTWDMLGPLRHAVDPEDPRGDHKEPYGPDAWTGGRGAFDHRTAAASAPFRMPADLPPRVQGQTRAAHHGLLGRLEESPSGGRAGRREAFPRPQTLSTIRPLIRAGVDETTAMKVSDHKTRSMLFRYSIVTERETADALLRADTYLSTQPTRADGEKGQLRDIRTDGGGKSLTGLRGVGSSRRLRTEDQPPTPDDSDPIDPDLKPTRSR